jgi:AI-2 transport system permease protein
MKVSFKKLFEMRGLSAAFFLIILFLICGIINPSFLDPSNLLLCFNGSVMYILLGIGCTFVIMTGDIDVSVGSILGLTGAVIGASARDGVSMWLAVPATLLLGAALGLINGFGVAKLHVPSIIMTLGTMGVIRGVIYIYTEGKWVENLPDYFKNMSQANILSFINVFFLVTLCIVVLLHIAMIKTKRGRYFIAVGDNVNGATLIGIPIARTRIVSFVLSGVFSALAGIVFASEVGFIPPTAGTGYEMNAIAACVIGGVSLSGGVGSIVGVFFGSVIMSSIGRILVFLKAPSSYNDVITGILLIAIVVTDAMIQHHYAETSRKERLSARVVKQKEAV